MYCVNCGSPVTTSVSYCNHCGNSLKEKAESSRTGAITAFLTAIVLIGICGLGIMLGGSLVLRKEAGLPVELVGFFMLCTFLIVSSTEFMLVRNLSKLTGSSANKTRPVAPTQPPPLELRASSTAGFGESIGSVTDNTTRTLEYARREN